MIHSHLTSSKKVVITKDSSNTLYSSEFDECYHSVDDGALTESLSKHITPAFHFATNRDKLTILDICFGLGYNTFATIYYCKVNNIKTKIEIISPEMDVELIGSLKTFCYPPEFDALKEIIYAISNNFFYEDDQFKITLMIGDAREILQKCTAKFEIIYQDAFSPKKNPLLWTKEYFANLKDLSTNQTILTTYSVASSARLAMSESGFRVYEYVAQNTRRSTIGACRDLPLQLVDMELKKSKNSKLRSLRDEEFI